MDKYQLQKLRDLPIEGVAERMGMQVVNAPLPPLILEGELNTTVYRAKQMEVTYSPSEGELNTNVYRANYRAKQMEVTYSPSNLRAH